MSNTKIIARVSLRTIVDAMNAKNNTSYTTKHARVILRKNRVAKIDDNYAFVENEIARIQHMIDKRNYRDVSIVRAKRVRRARVVVDATSNVE